MAAAKIKSPRSTAQFHEICDEYARKKVRLASIEASVAKRIQKVEAEAQPEIECLKAEMKAMHAVAEDYAKDHMGELFEDDRKSAESASATYRFLENSRRLVQFNRWTEVESIASLETAGLTQFVTTKKSLNKDELKTKLTHEELKGHGLKIAVKENFEIDPHADIAAAV